MAELASSAQDITLLSNGKRCEYRRLWIFCRAQAGRKYKYHKNIAERCVMQVDGSESEVKGRQHCVKKIVSDIQVFVPNSGTSGTTIHKVVLDPTVHHAEKLVLSDRLVDDYQTVRPPHKDIDLVNAKCVTNDTIYKHPIISGCEEHNLMGQASEALAEFEKLQSTDKSALHELLRIGAVQDAKWYPNTLGWRSTHSGTSPDMSW
ncbi:hypothetical protein GEV33_000807 [Tenebrio molitor]|uniref:Uncharacterized protein n=1 Tax=Tenebrio molitor TaxID=7067 RepID=A0A8J6HW93_TENMO|nr:hypothetical protein GEV33_000807 [Tenebrio molitor]